MLIYWYLKKISGPDDRLPAKAFLRKYPSRYKPQPFSRTVPHQLYKCTHMEVRHRFFLSARLPPARAASGTLTRHSNPRGPYAPFSGGVHDADQAPEHPSGSPGLRDGVLRTSRGGRPLPGGHPWSSAGIGALRSTPLEKLII